MKATVVVESNIIRSPRVMQIEGLFDVPPTERAVLTWEVNLPIEERPWNVGLIVGPSGSGKSTVARKLWPEQMARRFEWDPKRSILDAFPADMGVKEIAQLLSSVGFSSPPSWVRPFGVLSNGEQFRVTMARILAETPKDEVAVVDEFTSVVDRTVARIGSHAIAKTVRRRGQKFVAVTCHEDVEEWLQPDWVFRPAEQVFAWRELQRRPEIKLEIFRVHHSAWRIFQRYHYLSADHNPTAKCFVAMHEGQPVAWTSWLPHFGQYRRKKIYRGHRLVVLPDFQGVGIGQAVHTFAASIFAGLGFRAVTSSSHPAEIAGRLRNPAWKLTRAPARATGGRSGKRPTMARSRTRAVASFEYIGPPMDRDRAEAIMNTWIDL